MNSIINIWLRLAFSAFLVALVLNIIFAIFHSRSHKTNDATFATSGEILTIKDANEKLK